MMCILKDLPNYPDNFQNLLVGFFFFFFLKSPGTSRALSPVGAWLSAGSSQALFRQQCRQGRQPAQLEHRQGAGAGSAVREWEMLGCFG